jgi:hypothetical protein
VAAASTAGNVIESVRFMVSSSDAGIQRKALANRNSQICWSFQALPAGLCVLEDARVLLLL